MIREMKRYLLFAWYSYEAQGGFNDFIIDSNERETLVAYLLARGYSYGQIFDRETLKIENL